MPVEITSAGGGSSSMAHAQQLNGHYLAPMPPGHYRIFGIPVEVKPAHWTRLDLKLPG
jgi:hypothetical protein